MIKRFFNTPWGKTLSQTRMDVPDIYLVKATDGCGVYIPRKYLKFLSESCINKFAINPDLNADGLWFDESVCQRPILEIKSHVGQVNCQNLADNLRTILHRDLIFIETSHPLAKEINMQICRGNREIISAIQDLQNYK